MNIAAIAFTERGQQWEKVLNFPVDRGVPVMEWTRTHFDCSDALLFIGACGIAVRAIAPLIRGKTTDPAVLVMDELGRHIISLLSGHIGGANDLTLALAEKTGADPVITTATDLRGIPAIDSFAIRENCAIQNPAAIAPVASATLAGTPVGVAITERTLKAPFPVTLWLRPRTLVLGAGCRRGTDPALFENTVRQFLDNCGVSLLSLRALATIDRKQEEPAFVTFCQRYRLPLLTSDAETLSKVPGIFHASPFVEATVGVDNVCERAAALHGGTLLTGKTVRNGITLALAGEAQI
ncbi:MAG: cobalt-precorrin 5A hydrolase [Clostridia bacterium]|nr:cobalt-precorrin 5A hydrolase [Clostridia bacterium]